MINNESPLVTEYQSLPFGNYLITQKYVKIKTDQKVFLNFMDDSLKRYLYNTIKHGILIDSNGNVLATMDNFNSIFINDTYCLFAYLTSNDCVGLEETATLTSIYCDSVKLVTKDFIISKEDIITFDTDNIKLNINKESFSIIK